MNDVSSCSRGHLSEKPASRYLVGIAASPVLTSMLEAARELTIREWHRAVSLDAAANGQVAETQDIDILLLTPRAQVEPDFLARFRRLRCVILPTIGVDPVDAEDATQRGILVGHSAPEESVISMAEATVGLMAMLGLKLDPKQAALAAGRWRDPAPLLGRMLHGRTVGLIGFGRIGRMVARLLEPWSVKLLVHDPAVEHPAATTLDHLLAVSDVVSLHVNFVSGNAVIGRRELALMKPDALLINTARGGLVDETALADALEAGRLGGAALDTFAREPLPLDSRLRGLGNVILTPHNAGHTQELMDALEREFLLNVAAALAGKPPTRIYNPAALPAWRARFDMTAGQAR